MPVLKRKRKTAADRRFDEQVKRLHVHDAAIADRRWVSVLESLPPNGRMVLIAVGGHVFTGSYSDLKLVPRLKNAFSQWTWEDNRPLPAGFGPSHWMPYPESPLCDRGSALPRGTRGMVSASTR
jgi:hypothetical protein